MVGFQNQNYTFKWYDSADVLLYQEVGVKISNFTTPSLNVPSTVYKVAVTNGLCTSGKVDVTAYINNNIGSVITPSVTGTTLCGKGSATISASSGGFSGVFRWYDAATGGNIIQTTPAATSSSFTSPVLTASKTYWVTFDRGINSGGVSARVPVTVTINTPPPAPSVTDNFRCGSGEVILSAIASVNGMMKWYTTASGGTPEGSPLACTTGIPVSFNTGTISSTTD